MARNNMKNQFETLITPIKLCVLRKKKQKHSIITYLCLSISEEFLASVCIVCFHFQFTSKLLEYMYIGAVISLYLCIMFWGQLQPALWWEGFLVIHCRPSDILHPSGTVISLTYSPFPFLLYSALDELMFKINRLFNIQRYIVYPPSESVLFNVQNLIYRFGCPLTMIPSRINGFICTYVNIQKTKLIPLNT